MAHSTFSHDGQDHISLPALRVLKPTSGGILVISHKPPKFCGRVRRLLTPLLPCQHLVREQLAGRLVSSFLTPGYKGTLSLCSIFLDVAHLSMSGTFLEERKVAIILETYELPQSIPFFLLVLKRGSTTITATAVETEAKIQRCQ